MKRKIGSLDAHCRQWEAGYMWVGQVKSIVEHDEICGYVQQRCINCGIYCMKKDKTKHEQTECPRRRVTCQHCGIAVGPYKWITEEHHKVCRKIIIACPRGCGQNFSQKHEVVEQHKKVCTHEPVSCPFEKVGCKEKPIRSKVDEHQTSTIQQHLE